MYFIAPYSLNCNHWFCWMFRFPVLKCSTYFHDMAICLSVHIVNTNKYLTCFHYTWIHIQHSESISANSNSPWLFPNQISDHYLLIKKKNEPHKQLLLTARESTAAYIIGIQPLYVALGQRKKKAIIKNTMECGKQLVWSITFYRSVLIVTKWRDAFVLLYLHPIHSTDERHWKQSQIWFWFIVSALRPNHLGCNRVVEVEWARIFLDFYPWQVRIKSGSVTTRNHGSLSNWVSNNIICL